jgi:hypothetical protein
MSDTAANGSSVADPVKIHWLLANGEVLKNLSIERARLKVELKD